MNKKHIQVVDYLLKTKDWTTSTFIANQICSSTRSVKSYISELNAECPGLIESGQNGYLINRQLALNLLNSENKDNNIPQTNKERTLYLITKLIREEKPIDVYDFCDEIFISLSTFKLILKSLKEKLDTYGLTLINNNSLLSIKGDEAKKRKLLTDCAFSETNSTYFDIGTIQAVFTNIDTDYTINTLKEVLWENKYFISDLTITSIVLHIIVAIDRNFSNPGQNKNRKLKSPDYVPSELNNMVFELITRLEDYYSIKFSNDDVIEFTMLIYSRTYSLDTNAMDDEKLQTYLGNEAINIINEMLHELKESYNIEITNKESRIFFSIHIKNLLIRSKTQNFSRNPLTSSVKSNAPLIYDVAVSLSRIITKYTGIDLIDDEIAFIAFHIGTTMEKDIANKSRISVILYCPTYYNMEIDLKESISNRFSNDIIIDNIVTGSLHKKQAKNIDLIISTVPVKGIDKVEVVNISVFMNMIDVMAIEKAINNIRGEKKKREFVTNIKRMTSKEFYSHIKESYTKKQILSLMCKDLTSKGYANKNFLNDVLDREKLSSTQYDNFAIPHTIKMKQNKSCISICILDKPINWNNNDVDLIALLCLTEADKECFYNLFETLSLLFMNKVFIQKLYETKTYENMLELFEDYNNYVNIV